MKTILLFLFLCVLSFTATAQSKIKWGLQAGINLSQTAATGGDFDAIRTEQHSVLGFNAGLVADITLAKILLLCTGLHLEKRGFSYEVNQSVIHYEAIYRPYYLHIPVIAALTNGKLYIGAGPYVAYGVSGSYHAEWAGPDYLLLPSPQDRNIRWGENSLEDDFRRFDAGLQFEAGLTMRQFRLSANYAFGLANLQPYPGAGQISQKNRTLSLALSAFLVQ